LSAPNALHSTWRQPKRRGPCTPPTACPCAALPCRAYPATTLQTGASAERSLSRTTATARPPAGSAAAAGAAAAATASPRSRHTTAPRRRAAAGCGTRAPRGGGRAPFDKQTNTVYTFQLDLLHVLLTWHPDSFDSENHTPTESPHHPSIPLLFTPHPSQRNTLSTLIIVIAIHLACPCALHQPVAIVTSSAAAPQAPSAACCYTFHTWPPALC
jgi:hypothetical protein